MNKNRITGIVLIAFAMSMFFSCKNTNKSSGTAIAFDSITVAEKIPLLPENDTTLPYSQVDIKFTYPAKFGTKEDLKRLQQIFIGTFFNDQKYDSLAPQAATDTYLANYKKEYTLLSNDYYSDKQRLPAGEMPVWYWYQLSNTNKILFHNDSLLSYAVEYSDYTGGAHGSYRITYYNIDLKDIVTVSEEDIFKPNYKKPLTNIIVRSLMKQYNVNSPDSLIQQGFFNIEDIAPNNNFWMNEKGLHYAFNQYEIAPYSMGVIDVTVPYADLDSILKPGNLVERFFPKKSQ
ncbi:MAG: DUF3298 domain-containing protein [Petrimonas sp.]|nr:DUF3298 domain-containing protein [Petrimonas sp.]